MTTTVLAYFPSPAQGVWYLGPIPIRARAVHHHRHHRCPDARRPPLGGRGGERGVIYDIALWAVPFGLIGGRIYHLMTDWKTYFRIRRCRSVGGTAHLGRRPGHLGAVAFGGVGAWSACRRRGIPLPAFGDAIAPGIVLAQAIGRLGNYFNQELYGRETTVPWGMGSSIDGTRREWWTCTPSTVCRLVRWPPLSTRRSFTNCCGTSWCSWY